MVHAVRGMQCNAVGFLIILPNYLACRVSLLYRAAIGWAVSCSAFGLFFFLVSNYIQTSADNVIISQL